jgi:integrase
MRYADKHKGLWRARIVVWPVSLCEHLPAPYTGRKVFLKSTGIPVNGGDADEAQRRIDDYKRTVADPAIQYAERKMRGEDERVLTVDFVNRHDPAFFDKVALAAIATGANVLRFTSPPVAPIAAIPLASVMPQWASEREIGPKTERAYTAIVEDFFRNLSLRHTDLAKIDTAQFELFRANLRERSDAGEFSLVSAEKRLEAVKTIFKFAHKTGVKIDDAVRKLPVNPAKGVERFGAKGSRRLDLEDDERALILREAVKSDAPIIKWGNLLAGFTGARIAEIAELRTTDIRTLADGTVVMVLRADTRDENQTLKTEESERRVPLHPAILRWGFMDYVKSVGTGPLFPSVPLDRDGRRNHYASNTVGKWFRLLISDQRKSFHSWRHDVKTRLHNANVPEKTHDYITGHADLKVGRRYIHPTMAELVAAIGTLDDPTESMFSIAAA